MPATTNIRDPDPAPLAGIVALTAILPLLALTAPAAAATVLPTPVLRSGENLRHEGGLVNRLFVDRYTWRDSRSRPRSVSLVRYGQNVNGHPRGGYANQVTYQTRNATTHAWSTIRISPAKRAKKLAWGSAPYVGTSLATDDGGAPFVGYPIVSYRVWLTFDASAGAKTRALAASIH